MALEYVSTEENIEAFNKPEEFAQKIQDLADATHAHQGRF
jgi:hypothetical protein